jgi:lauroyl/myristoyl acyltransferase
MPIELDYQKTLTCDRHEVADATRMNAWIEARVREMPAQYLWVHKRFKTRPPGMRSLYE